MSSKWRPPKDLKGPRSKRELARVLGCPEKEITRADYRRYVKEYLRLPEWIAPGLYQCGTRKISTLHKITSTKYKFENHPKYEDATIGIISNTTNHRPELIEWCHRKRLGMIHKPTKSEAALREFLNEIGKFNYVSQKTFIIDDKVYFADFYFEDYQTIIEVDGASHSTPEQKLIDTMRTAFLNSAGITVLRMTNKQAQDKFQVSDVLLAMLQSQSKGKSKKQNIAK